MAMGLGVFCGSVKAYAIKQTIGVLITLTDTFIVLR